MKMKRIFQAAVFVLTGTALFFAGRGCGDTGRATSVVTRIDTLVVRDTIRDTVLVPVAQHIVRTDTVFMKAAGDTVFVAIEVPIEQKAYETADYRAVVQGFRPALVEMEVYRSTVRIDRDIRQTIPLPQTKRWGVGVHAGYGITTKGAAPYIGIGVQYNIVAW